METPGKSLRVRSQSKRLEVNKLIKMVQILKVNIGGVAQMVERPLSMREVPGSIPGISILFFNN